MSRQANRRSRSLRQQRRKGYKAAGYIRGTAPNKMEEASRSEASLHRPKRESRSRILISAAAGRNSSDVYYVNLKVGIIYRTRDGQKVHLSGGLDNNHSHSRLHQKTCISQITHLMNQGKKTSSTREHQQQVHDYLL